MDRFRHYLPVVAHGFVIVSAAAILAIRRYRQHLLQLRSPPGCQHIDEPLPLWHMEPTVRKLNFPMPLQSHHDLHSAPADDYSLFCLSKFVACLHADDSMKLFQLTTVHTFSPGTDIFNKGDPSGSGLVLILSGSVQLFITNASGHVDACGSMQAGHSLGAFDVIDSGPRCITARVSADSHARLAFISHDAFWRFFNPRPGSILQYIKVALSRLWRISQFMLGPDFLNVSFAHHGIDVPDVITDISHTVLQQLLHLRCEQLAEGTIFPGFTEDSSDSDNDEESWAMLAIEGSFTLSDTHNLHASPSSPVLVGLAGLLGSSEIRLKVTTGLTGLRFIRLTPSVLGDMLHNAQRDGVAVLEWTSLVRIAAQLLVPVMRFFVEIGMQRLWRRSGDVLYKQGDINRDGVLVIITGRVKLEKGRRYGNASIHSSASQRALQAREQSVSSWFCETPISRNYSHSTSYASRKSVLGVRSYSKSVYSEDCLHDYAAVCARDSELVRLPPATVRACTRLVHDFPWRLLNNNSSVDTQLVTIAAIPLSNSACALSRNLIQQLALAFLPSVTVVCEEDLERRFGNDMLKNLHMPFFRERVVQFLHHTEEKYKHVILFANSVESPWASIAVANADITLMLALFHSPAASSDEIDLAVQISDAEQKLVGEANHGRYELVLLHASESPPRNTRKWLISRDWLLAHHHMRMVGGHVQTNDVYRLSRRIAGMSVGLVLSGGGGKGLAHYGLFQALECNKMPIDFVGGTSQGAFMGALYCMTESSEKMRPFVLRLSAYIGSTLGKISDFTFPHSAFFSGREFSLAVRDALGKDAYIEDLWLPFFCVSTNLSSYVAI
jgi:CRP-like cAMP-binding protein